MGHGFTFDAESGLCKNEPWKALSLAFTHIIEQKTRKEEDTKVHLTGRESW
jgi:hypothetical protein